MDRALDFLRELVTQQAANPDREPSGQSIVDALQLTRTKGEGLLKELLDDGLVQVIPTTTPRMGDGPLDELLKITTPGRIALERLADDPTAITPPGTPLPDTYTTRDLPVLREAARILDSEAGMYGCRFGSLVSATGLSTAQVELALRALEIDGLLEVLWAAPREASRISGLSSEARRKVGLWPTPATALDRMIAALEAIADSTNEEPDTRKRARKILDNLGGAGRQIGISVAAAAISGQIPGV